MATRKISQQLAPLLVITGWCAAYATTCGLAQASPQDDDSDGIDNAVDNCTLVANADQRDSNDDGFGNACDPDVNDDLIVDVDDRDIVRSRLFTDDPDADFDGNGIVSLPDLRLVRDYLGLPPGPAGELSPPYDCTRHREGAADVVFQEEFAHVIDPLSRVESLPHMAALPVGEPLDKLLLLIPGTDRGYYGDEQEDSGPEVYQDFLRTAAAGGYHVMGLIYVNELPTSHYCLGDDWCYGLLHREMLLGENFLPYDDFVIARENSIEGRLVKFLEYLGWSQFLREDGLPQWDKIAVAGHSQGGSHAAFTGKIYGIDRSLIFAAPNAGSWSQRREDNFETPVDAYFGFTSIHDSPLYTVNSRAWTQLMIPGEQEFVDTGSPPANNSNQLVTSICAAREGYPGGTPPNDDGTCPLGSNEHSMMIVDEFVPATEDGEPLYRDVWCYMLSSPIPE
ncbi:MAG: hypothetical protein AAGA68_27385 [Pseudomonadota bacterium]